MKSARIALLIALAAGSIQAQQPPDIREGFYNGKRVIYEVVNGMAVVEGDIILGTPEQLTPRQRGSPRLMAAIETVAINDPTELWPDRTVYYTIDEDLPNPERVLDAIRHWESKAPILRFEERISELNWVISRSRMMRRRIARLALAWWEANSRSGFPTVAR